jgi:hypothetical protein
LVGRNKGQDGAERDGKRQDPCTRALEDDDDGVLASEDYDEELEERIADPSYWRRHQAHIIQDTHPVYQWWREETRKRALAEFLAERSRQT